MLGRLGKADEIAGPLLFLASPASSFITGSAADGGWWLDALGDKSMNMAFLSSFRIGQQTVYPEELRERLAGFRCWRMSATRRCKQSAGRGQLVRPARRHAAGARRRE